MQRTNPAKTVDEYLAALPDEVQKMLAELRRAIKSAAPEAEEMISYQIPTYKHHGALVHFAAFEKHCSLIVVNKDILQTLAPELKPYKTTGTTIQFTTGNPLPVELVKKIVAQRVQENEKRGAAAKAR